MKPIAFRIKDFRSIHDTGECMLAGDNITILAGQNEAGKSAVLMALRDFDLEEGNPPQTEDYFPDGKEDARPTVSVLFEVGHEEIANSLGESQYALPAQVRDYLKRERKMWVIRDLESGKYSFENALSVIWLPKSAPSPEPEATAPEAPAPPAPVAEPQPGSDPIAPSADLSTPRYLPLSEAASELRGLWPHFLYFDTFNDQLPRHIPVEPLQSARQKPTKPPAATLPGQSSVDDFILLAGVDLDRVIELKEQDKGLSNYLRGRTATVTGDFQEYWKQTVDGKQKVNLTIRHLRDTAGTLKFAFYVTDEIDQYPEQRSKGFLWFLSFFLRLAAEEKRHPSRRRLLLIDEPGTYLHAKAQRDVLRLIEQRLAVEQHVLYSTHSPYLIPREKLHRLRIVLRDGTGGTVVLDRLTHPTLRGTEFADTLSPIITAIGLDIRERLDGLAQRNILVEGITDYLYFSTWRTEIGTSAFNDFAIFPGTGAGSLPTLASLCIGWGLEFSVMLDRDAEGEKTAKIFERELLVPPLRIIQPSSATTIEDLFDKEEFRVLLTMLDATFTLESNETPSKAIKRQKVDKVFLAQKFCETPSLFPKSAPNFERLWNTIANSFVPPAKSAATLQRA
jgi:hypothetical protein